jgi:hypothetical protein
MFWWENTAKAMKWSMIKLLLKNKKAQLSITV